MNLLVRAVSAVASVNVSVRPQPDPISAPTNPRSSTAWAMLALKSSVPQPSAVSSPR
jgi:hypothetical protein